MDPTKRVFDCAVASAALIVLAPVMAVVAVLVLVTMGPPVFFVQARTGLGGRPFRIVKFRTMAADDGSGSGDEERLTPLGRRLRAASLDELPELWNVLKGDMSLVGPRPLLVDYLPLYSAEQSRRHEVRPGITGWAQVNGRNALSWPRKFALDVWYVTNRSMRLDLRILLVTVRDLLKGEGIRAEGHATMPRFSGERDDAA